MLLLRSLARIGVSHASLRALSGLTLATGVASLAAFLTQLLLARGLEPRAYGAMVTALTAITLLSPLATFGVGKLWLRIFGVEGWSGYRWLRGSISLVIVATVSAFGLIVVWALQSGLHPTIRSLSLILAPTLAIYPLSELVYARLQLEERYGALAILQSIPNVVRFTIATVAAALGLSATGTAVGFVLALSAVAILFVTILQRMWTADFRLVGHGDPPTALRDSREHLPMREVASEAWPFALAGVFYLVYFQSDVVLLGWMIGPEAAGMYNIAFVVMAAVYLLPSIVHQKFLLPKLHRWAAHDRARFLEVFRFGNGTTLLLGFVIMVVVAAVAPWGIPLMFGETYVPAGRLLLLLAPAIPARYISTSVGASLVTENHMRTKVWLMGISALVNILLNLLLIPILAIYGAALATIGSEVVLLAGYLFAVRRYVFGPEAWRGWKLSLSPRTDTE